MNSLAQPILYGALVPLWAFVFLWAICFRKEMNDALRFGVGSFLISCFTWIWLLMTAVGTTVVFTFFL